VHKGSNTTIIQGDSTDTRVQLSLKQHSGSFRFFSIDGGHSAEHTINDLKFACDLISNSGVVILDDVFHPHWLGVTEGLCKFLTMSPSLMPFGYGRQKLYLAKLSFCKHYFEIFDKSPLKTAVSIFFGYPLVVLLD
jgi:Methyltransferase domain